MIKFTQQEVTRIPWLLRINSTTKLIIAIRDRENQQPSNEISSYYFPKKAFVQAL